MIDIGTGAGFPGVPLKLLRPDIKMTLMDASGKKTDFIRRTLAHMGIEAEVLCARAEEAARTPLRGHFDDAVSRAVAALPVLLEPPYRCSKPAARWRHGKAKRRTTKSLPHPALLWRWAAR